MFEKDVINIKEEQAFLEQETFSLDDFTLLIAFLASDNGCPWDRIQTPQTLRKHLLEEAYEAYDAIEQGSDADLKEELGDLLLQIVFQANLAQSFTVQDVLNGIAAKMIGRHSHVFGDDRVEDPTEVLDVWEANKRKEKAQASHTEALASVTRALPALARASKLQAKAAKAGFDWSDITGPAAKISEELAEAEEARLILVESATEEAREELEMEVGDLLFAVVNWARHAGIDPEIALDRSNQKFLKRFTAVEERVHADQKQMHDLDLETLDTYWDLVKKEKQERHPDED